MALAPSPCPHFLPAVYVFPGEEEAQPTIGGEWEGEGRGEGEGK